MLTVLGEESGMICAMTHLRFAGLAHDEQIAALERIVRGNAVLMDALTTVRELGLPDAWIASGAIYNSVWNELTGRPLLTGIKDVDLIYFDAADPSFDAEDRIIARVNARFAGFVLPVETRNQARVHLWYPERFGHAYPKLTHATQSLDYYASKTHAVAVRLDAGDTLRVEAPFGLDLMFSFRMVPNHALANRETHERKGARAKAIWPELVVEPW